MAESTAEDWPAQVQANATLAVRKRRPRSRGHRPTHGPLAPCHRPRRSGLNSGGVSPAGVPQPRGVHHTRCDPAKRWGGRLRLGEHSGIPCRRPSRSRTSCGPAQQWHGSPGQPGQPSRRRKWTPPETNTGDGIHSAGRQRRLFAITPVIPLVGYAPRSHRPPLPLTPGGELGGGDHDR